MEERLEALEEIKEEARDLLPKISETHELYFISCRYCYKFLDLPKLVDDLVDRIYGDFDENDKASGDIYSHLKDTLIAFRESEDYVLDEIRRTILMQEFKDDCADYPTTIKSNKIEDDNLQEDILEEIENKIQECLQGIDNAEDARKYL